MRIARIFAGLCFLQVASLSQQAGHLFEVRLPGFFDRSFEGGLIEIPCRPIDQLQLLVLETEQRGVSYGNIFVKINGKGAGNVFDRRPSEKGILLTMDASRLRLRPDQLLDPRENTLEVIAQDRRGRRYYQNWIIRTAETGRNELFAYASSVPSSSSAGSPPDLLLEEPRFPPVILAGEKSIQVRLKGIVSATAAGTSVSLNGGALMKPTSTATAVFDETVPVSRETKELILEATDQRGTRRSVTIPVVAQSVTPPNIRIAGQRYAVVIGVSRFGKEGQGALPVLPGAAADAREISSKLKERLKVPPGNLRLLLDEEATVDQIRSVFTSFAAKAQGDDMLIVYVASYGLHDPYKPEKLYVAAHGTQLKALDTTAIEFEQLEMLVDRNVRCNNSVFLFDVSHEMPGTSSPSNRNMINNYLLNLFDEQEGRAVLVSGSTDQVGIQRNGGESISGLFTYWITEALAGGADLNKDRIVTTEEIFAFVAQKVREETKGQQIPRYRLASRAAQRPILGGLEETK